MNLNTIRPKHDTEDLLLSITLNCETFMNKIMEKLKEYWNLNLPNQEKHFPSNLLSQLKAPE